MLTNIIDFYGAALSVLNQRATLIADNIANADTPNYKATDVSFDDALRNQLGVTSADAGPLYRQNGVVGLNGNDVSLDSERLEATENGERMEATVSFMRQSTSDLITAFRPNPSGA
ncbi:flagellar basal body protein [Acidocella sp.]|uniref:flagellar basal body rod protein FlgB n=1 Tax=Acidocella sp. TaxID=50710 RepID=UPI002617C670|nr:flagellar basal body protein [Acidocella sp.]